MEYRRTGEETIAEGTETANSHKSAKDNGSEFPNHHSPEVERDRIRRSYSFGREGDKVCAIGQYKQDQDQPHGRV
jgi:hypothetical protein